MKSTSGIISDKDGGRTRAAHAQGFAKGGHVKKVKDVDDDGMSEGGECKADGGIVRGGGAAIRGLKWRES